MPRADGRTRAARRLRALIESCVSEIGGDLTGLSELDRLDISKAASPLLQVETLQAKLASGEPVIADDIIRTSSEARRSLSVVREKAEQLKAERERVARIAARNERFSI